MKKPLIQSIAAAVAVALVSSAANAALTGPPGQPAVSAGGATGTGNGLYLAVFNDADKVTDLIALGGGGSNYLYAGVSYALNGTGTATLSDVTSGTEPFTSGVTNPAGSGTVYQMNFGQISNYSQSITLASGTVTTVGNALFGSSNVANTEYMVVDANGGNHTSADSTIGSTPYAGGPSVITAAIQSEASTWYSITNTGPLVDTTGTASYAAVNGLGDGTLGGGVNFDGSVGTALKFYQYSTTGGNFYYTQYVGNNGGAGFWYLSNTGDVSWNIASATAPVPLPAAVWLFASGIVGLGAIGRRRRGDVQPA